MRLITIKITIKNLSLLSQPSLNQQCLHYYNFSFLFSIPSSASLHQTFSYLLLSIIIFSSLISTSNFLLLLPSLVILSSLLLDLYINISHTSASLIFPFPNFHIDFSLTHYDVPSFLFPDFASIIPCTTTSLQV